MKTAFSLQFTWLIHQKRTRKSVLFIACFLLLTISISAQNVTTYAGSGSAGFVNGTLTSCEFNGGEQMAFDKNGNLLIADALNHVIRKIDLAGNVTTFAGTGVAGFVNGKLNAAQFNTPLGILVDKHNNVYVSEDFNFTLRKIDTSGNVTTYAGTGVAGYQNGPAATAQFGGCAYICMDDSMNIYVADVQNHSIRKIDTADNVSTFAGGGISGFLDGTGENALFNRPISITFNEQQQVFYVADRDNNVIRKITRARVVTTIAGTGTAGHKDGIGDSAMFNGPKGIITDSIGNIYVAGRLDQTIRKIDLQYNVSTIAGVPLTIGYQDGPAASAQFNRPVSVLLSQNNQLFISDYYNYAIRKLDSVSYISIPKTELSEIAFTVYPNPASHSIQLNGLAQKGNFTATIYNVAGQKVYSATHTAALNLKLDVEDFAAGVYWLHIINNMGSGAAYFIKN